MKRLLIIQFLFFAFVMTACDSSSMNKTSSAKPETHQVFEKKAKEILLYTLNAKSASRESEAGDTKKAEFWSQVTGMKVENWKCKFFDRVAPWNAESSKIKNHYVINCKDVDAKNDVEAFSRGKFMLWIPDNLEGVPKKIYDGDLIEWSGVIKRGTSFGLVDGFAAYELIIEVTRFRIYTKNKD